MTITIQIPYYPKEIYESKGVEQLGGVVKLFDRVQNEGINAGLQIFSGNTSMLGYLDKKGIEKFTNIIKTKIGTLDDSTFHMPICPQIPDERLNLITGKEYISNLIEILLDSGYKKFTLHTSTVYKNNTESGKYSWTNSSKKDSTKVLDYSEDLATTFPEAEFTYENMPFPIMGDYNLDPKKVNIEPNLILDSDIVSFFGKSPNVGLCLDTSHYILAKNALEFLKENQKYLENSYTRALIGSLDKNADLKTSAKEAKQILSKINFLELSKFVSIMLPYIKEVQLADASSFWKPMHNNEPGQLIKEGTPIHSDSANYENLRSTIIQCNNASHNIGVSLDVEEKDYIKRENQNKTLDLILSWI